MSEYTNCNPENECTGCTRCSCLADRKWSCQEVKDCGAQNKQAVDLEGIQDALFQIENNFASFHRDQAASSKTPFVPRPPDQDLLLGLHSSEKVLDFDIASLYRNKRSVDNNNKTSVKFYHTVDELNEDTLKNHNMSGTLQAQKVGVVKTPQISRRTGVFPTDNASQLRIAYTAPKAHDPHLADNQIEARHEDDQYDTLSHDKLHTISNHTQKQKDKDLSKIIVNELKPGKEIIGDKKAKVMSNITFTPANDTLTAMAFIAGNLLNKLWNMEKESGEDSIEIEVLKHEKISDLLDLFKEPLNLRQENFLKTALEQLSEAIHKNGNPQNVSLCDKIEEVKGTLRSANSSSEELIKKKDHKDSIESTIKETSFEKNPEVVTEAITKINDVLHLINKFQKIQKDLSDLKRKSNDINESVETKVYNKNKSPKDIGLTQDESTSLNTFGKILEKITKLLLPPKKSKKMAKSIRNQNVLKNSNDIAKQIKTMFNIDIDSSNLTPKDKIIFDYLSSVKRNPNCLLDSLSERNQSPITKTEGDILLNLSEFFKVKSFVDLLKMLETDTKTNTRTKDVLTTTEPEIVTEMTTTTLSTTTKVSKKLQDTKEKLKAHLKNIIDDLIELQNAKGKPTTNVSIVDALPCIYNILNADKNTQDTSLNVKTATVSPASKVASIFNSLKQELLASQTRRSNIITGERPKSAEVWERIIKHGDSKQNTRRNLEIKEPKTFEELKKLMDSIESGSKTYKNRAIMNGVPPSQRLVLLKTLFEDVRAYINVLEDIDNSMTNFEGLSTEKKTDLRDFVNNAEMNINLDEKISTHINNLKVKNNYIRGSDNKTIKKSNERNIPQKSMKLVDLNSSQERNNVKLSRNSIINQLIKNRMELYVKLKESHNADIDTDINYSIAKKILTYLEMGNYSLARELYKIIVPQKPKTPNVNRHSGTPIKRPSLFAKEPVVQFVEPRGQSQLQWLNQDIWLKQLSNLKNMRA